MGCSRKVWSLRALRVDMRERHYLSDRRPSRPGRFVERAEARHVKTCRASAVVWLLLDVKQDVVGGMRFTTNGERQLPGPYRELRCPGPKSRGRGLRAEVEDVAVEVL